MSKVTKKQVDQVRNQIHNLVVSVGELSLNADREFGEDSKQAHFIADILTPLAAAYEATIPTLVW